MRITSLIFSFSFLTAICFAQENKHVLDQSFSALKVTGNIHVELISQPQPDKVTYKGGEADELEITLNEEVLEMKTKSELLQDESIQVKLPYNQLISMEISRGGRVQSGDILKSEVLELDVLNGGKLELTLEVDSLNARVNQGADIILYGSARSQVVDAYTWGNYLAVEMSSQQATVEAATGAQVKLTVDQALDANATSKGFITYAGDPEKKKVKTSLGGEVTPLNP